MRRERDEVREEEEGKGTYEFFRSPVRAGTLRSAF